MSDEKLIISIKLTGEKTPQNMQLVALEEMITLDKTLNEIFDLEYGEEAHREFIGAHWIRSKI